MEAASFFIFKPSSASGFSEKDIAYSPTATHLVSASLNQTGMAGTPKCLWFCTNLNFVYIKWIFY
ncbi:MAG: hypothetical protein ACJATE_002364 [Bacteroidia bacterium]|jgi:hypothetical protein